MGSHSRHPKPTCLLLPFLFVVDKSHFAIRHLAVCPLSLLIGGAVTYLLLVL